MKCDEKIVKYLGITLLPQAGVALGMAGQARLELPEGGIFVYQITLFGVLIYELIGPMLTKISLTKAGEIVPEGKKSAREEAWNILSKLHLDHRHERHARHVERAETEKMEDNDKK